MFDILNKALDGEVFFKKNSLDSEIKVNVSPKPKVEDSFDFIPIEVVEHALRQIFKRDVDFKIMNTSHFMNSFVVTARIEFPYLDTGERRIIDGIGAVEIDVKGTGRSALQPSDPGQIQMAVGTAYSIAIKNAAKKLGRAFGSELNRSEEASRPDKPISKEEKVLMELERQFKSKSKKHKRTIKQISYLIRWTQENTFWKTNILSPNKLRQKWDKLVLQVKSEKKEDKVETILKVKMHPDLKD